MSVYLGGPWGETVAGDTIQPFCPGERGDTWGRMLDGACGWFDVGRQVSTAWGFGGAWWVRCLEIKLWNRRPDRMAALTTARATRPVRDPWLRRMIRRAKKKRIEVAS